MQYIVAIARQNVSNCIAYFPFSETFSETFNEKIAMDENFSNKFSTIL